MLSAYTQRAGFFCFAVACIELFLGPGLAIGSVRPDLFGVLIVFWAYVIDRNSALQLAMILGLVRDTFSSGFFGVETISYFCSAGLIALLSLKLEKHSVWIRGLTLFWFALIHMLAVYSLNYFLLGSLNFIGSIAGWAFWHSAYTALIGCWLIAFLEKRVFGRPRIMTARGQMLFDFQSRF